MFLPLIEINVGRSCKWKNAILQFNIVTVQENPYPIVQCSIVKYPMILGTVVGYVQYSFTWGKQPFFPTPRHHVDMSIDLPVYYVNVSL